MNEATWHGSWMMALTLLAAGCLQGVRIKESDYSQSWQAVDSRKATCCFTRVVSVSWRPPCWCASLSCSTVCMRDRSSRTTSAHQPCVFHEMADTQPQ